LKVLLVDDHTLLRESLAVMFANTWPELQLLQAGTLAEAVGHLRSHADVKLVLVDLTLPDATGLDGLAVLQRQVVQARHVVLSADDRTQTVLSAIDAGAAGFIPKTSEYRVMVAAIELVLQGGVYLPPCMAARGAPAPGAAEPASLEALGLSPRQGEVLMLLVEGHPNKTISRLLNISPSTVKTHLETIFTRLEVSSRTQAVVAVARLGLRLPVMAFERD
jgi:DNA-binding NarL/FixJ family response regulator